MAVPSITIRRTRGTLQPKDADDLVDCPECGCWHSKGGCSFADQARLAVDKAGGDDGILEV